MKKDTDSIESEVISESELAQLEEVGDIYTHKFSTPCLYDGKTYTELKFDFSSLTGGDSLDVEAELQAIGHAIIVRTLDGAYLTRMCSRACIDTVGSDIFRVMSAKDYGRITNVAKRFL